MQASTFKETNESLKSLFRPDFFSDQKEDLIEYGKDWSGVLTPNPSMIAFPKDTNEVSFLLKKCNELKIGVVPSGGRTGLSGGATASHGEIVLSLSKMNQIFHFNEASLTLSLQSGVITEKVHEYLKPYGLTWPVDFASKGSSTVGGNISTNAGGIRVIRYGLTRHWVLGLTAVLMNGEVIHCNGSLEKNNTGFDFRQLFIGTEGIYGVITEATLKCTPLPNESRTEVVLVSLKSFPALIALFRWLRNEKNLVLSAFETFTEECLKEVIQLGVSAPFSKNEQAEVYALFEFENYFQTESEYDLFWEKLMTDLESEMIDIRKSLSTSDQHYLWSLRERVAEAILFQREVHQQDLSVPVENLEKFVIDIKDRYAKNYPDIEVFLFGHIGDGNLHIFIRKPLSMESGAFHLFCEKSDQLLFEMTQQLNGSVSAEHGVGILKKPALPYSRSPIELELMRKMKRMLDPGNFLNPGKVLDL